MSSTQVNPNVNLTENVLVLDTNAVVTGEVTFSDQDIIVSGTASQLIFVGTPGGEASTYAGIQYRDSTHNNRYMLSARATNDVVLGNRAANGTVRIMGNAAAGAGGEVEAFKIEDDQTTFYTNVKKGVFMKAMDGDTTPTTVFTITTTNESGDADAGHYACFVEAIAVNNASATPNGNSGETATMAYKGFFCRAMENGGTGANSAVADATSSAVAATAAGTRTISTVAMSVVETSEYVQSVQFAVDGSGSSPTPLYVVAYVTLVWVGFTTAPTLTQA